MEIDKNKHANMINKMSNDSLKYQMEERKKMDMVAKLKKQEEFKERMDKVKSQFILVEAIQLFFKWIL